MKRGVGSIVLRVCTRMEEGAGGVGGVKQELVVDEAKHGFGRAEMYKDPLAGTVSFYERHVFLCYKDPRSWPRAVESAEFDRLPRHLFAALKARKNDMPKKTRLTICEGGDSSNGDVLIFPDMVVYRGLTHLDVDPFVEEVLVKEKKWGYRKQEKLQGSYVFVCAHASRDVRCGVCGPVLVEKFKLEISTRNLDNKVAVKACSHIGGHKYAGNVIVFSAMDGSDGNTADGNWYGYVTPEDVAALLDEQIGKGQIVDKLWRGQMCLTEEEQRKKVRVKMEEGCACGMMEKCCMLMDETPKKKKKKKITEVSERKKKESGKWKKEDKVLAAVAMGAAACLVITYCFYKTKS